MKEIARELVEINAFNISEVGYLWASGIRSPFYCDNRKILSYPSLWKKIVKLFCEQLQDHEFDGIAGVATAGIPHASAIAYEMNCPLIYVRSSAKEHGRKNQIEGDVKDIKSVALIEDLFSTGGSALKAAKALESNGIEVKVIASIFSYELKSLRENFQDYKYFSLLNVDDMISIHNLDQKKLALVESFLKELR